MKVRIIYTWKDLTEIFTCFQIVQHGNYFTFKKLVVNGKNFIFAR